MKEMDKGPYARFLKITENLAYPLAIWSFLVLFLEPIVAYYTDYKLVEGLTALANLVLLALVILGRLAVKSSQQKRRIIFIDVVMLVMGIMLFFYQAKFAVFVLLIRQSYFIITYLIFRAFEGRFFKLLTSNPPVTLMFSFLAVIVLGTVLLMFPASSTSGQVTPFVDALFTSTSATCVTGLIVVDTPNYFSVFGQVVILLLIQIGGLGIMTISTAFALILGQRLTLKLENVMHSVVGGTPSLDLFQLLKSIVLVTLIIEISGAIVLYMSFIRVMEPLKAFWYSLFHAISAFCNAGFALYSDNMMAYAKNLNVNLGITFLIILGGLGFTVIIDLYQHLTNRRKHRHLSLHTKLVLVTTASLLAGGMLAFYLAEYNNTMRGFTIPVRAMASWFQSVTTRTAGFNTIDIAGLSSASILVSLLLMFIGASPGGTGGGVKTSTFAVLMLSITSLLQGKKDLSVFNRKISLSNFRESASLITLSVLIVVSIIFALMLIEPFPFEDIAFEAVSAFGTVGLSTGITSKLSVGGKLLITLLMYIGRIGPLTMIYALSLSKRQSNIEFAEEKIAVG